MSTQLLSYDFSTNVCLNFAKLDFAVSLIELRTITIQFYGIFFPDPNTRKNFVASVGYAQKFLKINSIKLRNLHGVNEIRGCRSV